MNQIMIPPPNHVLMKKERSLYNLPQKPGKLGWKTVWSGKASIHLLAAFKVSVIIYPYLPRRISSLWQFQRKCVCAAPLIYMWHIHIPFEDSVHPCCLETVRGNNKQWILFCPYWVKSYSVACPAGNNTQRNQKKKKRQNKIQKERKGLPLLFLY